MLQLIQPVLITLKKTLDFGPICQFSVRQIKRLGIVRNFFVEGYDSRVECRLAHPIPAICTDEQCGRGSSQDCIFDNRLSYFFSLARICKIDEAICNLWSKQCPDGRCIFTCIVARYVSNTLGCVKQIERIHALNVCIQGLRKRMAQFGVLCFASPDANLINCQTRML